jgi:hypothetical protein
LEPLPSPIRKIVPSGAVLVSLFSEYQCKTSGVCLSSNGRCAARKPQVNQSSTAVLLTTLVGKIIIMSDSRMTLDEILSDLQEESRRVDEFFVDTGGHLNFTIFNPAVLECFIIILWM